MDNADKSEILEKLSLNDFANFFSISIDTEKDIFRYNINKNIYFPNVSDMIDTNYFKYTVSKGDTWTNISYKVYGTYKLWWIVCKVNGIKDPTEFPVENTTLMILNEAVVNQILRAIRA